QLLDAGAERLRERRERLELRGARAGGAHLREPLLHGGALLARDLAEEEVLRLDPVRALVDARDAAVAHELLDEELAAVAVAAEDLHGDGADLEARLAAVGLADRREERGARRVLLARRAVRAALAVELARRVEEDGAVRLRLRLALEEHAAHVRVLDDRDLLLGRRLAGVDLRALE